MIIQFSLRVGLLVG